MTNVLTLALRDLKGSTSLNPSKKRKMAKKTCLTWGSARNRKRCFLPVECPGVLGESVCAVVLKAATQKPRTTHSNRGLKSHTLCRV